MRALLAAALLAFALVASPATAATPRASLPDIEDEVMCLECGTALNVSTSDVADQERDFIAGLIAQGKTKAEVKAALVNEYGPRVLAEPQDDGFQLTAWIVPVLAALAALALVILVAGRWRGRARAGDAAAVAIAAPHDRLEPDDARRLDDELAAFDR
ncbi:MAG TPA: cytochrome c-type biogenesis protein CcmH [Solirubrobacteraceae bacterium]|nr:cytochrome c-type biogenesis protein CcmH [Solirubrobacteraceae bacterium]